MDLLVEGGQVNEALTVLRQHAADNPHVLLRLVDLLVEGGQIDEALTARQRADNIAAEAARAGGQAIDLDQATPRRSSASSTRTGSRSPPPSTPRW